MKNEKMLERCLELAVYLNDDDALTYNFFLKHKNECDAAFGVGGLLAALIHDLQDDIRFLMAFIEMEGADRLVEWWNADHGKE